MESKEKELAIRPENKPLAVKKKSAKSKPKLSESSINDSEIHRQVAVRAYELFEKRGRSHGRDLDDWLEAEKVVLGELESA
jgi:hypothetical protein